MNVTLLTYLIACPFAGLGGFVDSIAGGGGLISLPGYMIAGLSPHVASATNKISGFMGTSVAFGNYIKKGFVKIKTSIPCCIVALIFSSLGAKLQTWIPDNYLKIFMLIALPCTLLFILNKKSLESKNEGSIEFTAKEIFLALIISALLGIYDGAYGPGTGTFLLLFFVNIVKMNIKEANGLAKAINWATNAGALLTFISSGLAIIPLGIAAGVCGMLGNYIGSNLFAKKDAKIARPIMIIVMIIFIIKLIVEFVVK